MFNDISKRALLPLISLFDKIDYTDAFSERIANYSTLHFSSEFYTWTYYACTNTNIHIHKTQIYRLTHPYTPYTHTHAHTRARAHTYIHCALAGAQGGHAPPPVDRRVKKNGGKRKKKKKKRKKGRKKGGEEKERKCFPETNSKGKERK